MRAIWSGSLSFMLINIPVRLYSAVTEREFNFDMLHKSDLSPIRYARVCKSEEKEVPFNEITKGYQYQKGRYIVLTPDDFKRADKTKTSSISIVSFADHSQIDLRAYDKPYYLEPEEGSERSYELLRQALEKTGKVAIAKFVLRNKEHLAAILVHGNLLILEQIRFKDEIKKPEIIIREKPEIVKEELDLAIALIEKLTKDFHLEDHKDTYRQEIKRIIDEKITGKVPVSKGSFPRPTPIPDLMETLKKSLAEKEEIKAKV